ncbi:sialidase family protein [Geminicoccus flavidas]|uniref:sialidase family protein n=1 Tax=Geminicoccus flavidas TaxID=2506407 RepID=UPI00190F152B|nr:sialidase family protein [Geminicoccus flavidas]
MSVPDRSSCPPCRLIMALAGTTAVLLATISPGGSDSASAQELGPLTRVSTGKSSFTSCTADKPAQQQGQLFRNTEIEPFVAADPSHPSNLLVGYQQDRWSNGGARGDVAGVSLDGGGSWRTVTLPGVARCSDGEFLRASDPWVDFSRSGVAYFMSLAFEADLTTRTGEFAGYGRNGMLVSRSTNGGLSWSAPVTLTEISNRHFLNDKNSLTADPNDADLAYAVWDRLVVFQLPPPAGFPSGGGPVGARARAKWLKDAQAAKAAAQERQPTQIVFAGPTRFTRTTNGGRSWERPRVIVNPGPNAQTINNIIVVQPNGTLINFFTHIYANGASQIELLRSFDKGRSFERRPTAIDLTFGFGTITPDAQERVRDAGILFDVAVDPDSGALYLVWQDLRFRGVDEVAFAMSTDGGSNWSEPIRVNQTPANANRFRQQAFIPAIEVGPDGRLVVTHYDFRNDQGEGERTDYWAVFCDPRADDCRRASSWGDERRLTERSFNMLDAPVAGGRFLGDYMGLERAGGAVHPVFGIATDRNRTDLFTRRITFGAAGSTARTVTEAARE